LLNTNTDLSLLASCYSHREVHHTNTRTHTWVTALSLHSPSNSIRALRHTEHTEHRPTP